MPEVIFHLKSVKPDKNGKIPIVAQISHDYKKKRKHLPIKVKPAWWNKNKQRVYETKTGEGKKEREEINQFLNDYYQT